MRTTVDFYFVGEPLAKSRNRKNYSYEEGIPLAEIGDRISLHPAGEEDQWSGKVVNRTFVYSNDCVSVSFDIESMS